MFSKEISLKNLDAITVEDLVFLSALGIKSLSDLLSYQPSLDARIINAASKGILAESNARELLREDTRKLALSDIVNGSISKLISISERDVSVLSQLEIRTIKELFSWEAIAEAENVLEPFTREFIPTDPTAPDCVTPKCRKFTKDSKNYVSFFRAEDISDLKLTTPSKETPIHRLFNFNSDSCKSIYLGYSSTYRQDWTHCGIHLGEPLGSVSLFMGQDTQVSVVDWKRINRAVRNDNNQTSESLVNVLVHQRAVDEIARATAEEHQHGATSEFAANAATSGSFVAAGAVVGGVGGGVSGALAGLVLGNAANVAAGAPTIAGAAVGTAVGSLAGAAAGSLIYSGATTLGFIETDVDGKRDVVGLSGQRIQERAMQNASSLRSFWSNIVTQSLEDEQQQLRTERVTNYNKIHALNGIYFEILNRYQVNSWLTGVSPLIFIPFKPFRFDEEVLRTYWWILRQYMKEPDLIASIDSHFLTLNTESSSLETIESLPNSNEVEATSMSVSLDFDSSLMKDIIESALTSLVGAAVATAIFLLGGVIIVAGLLLKIFYEITKRELIEVELITDGADIALVKGSSPNRDPEFIGKYSTQQDVRISTISGVKIKNKNSNITLGIEGTPISIEISAVAFENVKVRLRLKDRSNLVASVPNLSDLEDAQNIGGSKIKVSGNAEKFIAWRVAEKFLNIYAGITEQKRVLDADLTEEEITQTKIQNLLGFLNANKYGFTRLILEQIEKEQLSCVLDQLIIHGIPLRKVAGTTPIGVSGSHIILQLKNGSGVTTPPPVTFDVDTRKLNYFLNELLIGLNNTVISVAVLDQTLTSLLPQLEQFIEASFRASVGNREPDRTLLDNLISLRALLESGRSIIGSLEIWQGNVISKIESILKFLKAPASLATGSAASINLLSEYFEKLNNETKVMRENPIASDEVSLPSSAIFMEPILSNAKGAELYDISRNSHYDIFEAPSISSSDPNLQRSHPVNLQPTIPNSVLQQSAPNAYPLPDSLKTSLLEAGKLDLSTLLQTNASSLTSTLTNLSNLATELAKASANLTGDAQKDVLSQASKIAETVGSIVDDSLNNMAELAGTMSETAPSKPPPPPQTLAEKGSSINEMKKIDESNLSIPNKRDRKRVLGVPKEKSKQKKYQFKILFSDEYNRAYKGGLARISATFFEYSSDIYLNGGHAIRMDDGGYFLPENYLLTPGRKVTFGIFTTFPDLPEIGSNIDFTLPSHPDVILKFSMATKLVKVDTTTVTKAVNSVINRSALSVDAKAALKIALETAANFGSELEAKLGTAFPFEIFDISAEGAGSVNGGVSGNVNGEAEVNLAGNYKSSEDKAKTNEDGTTKTRKFSVKIPLYAWKVEIR